MKFGKVDNPELIDFTIPKDHKDTTEVFNLNKRPKNTLPKIFVGCSRWGKKDLKNFYPKGTKDELTYYASQFNCVELNASFYRIFPPEQFAKWKEKTTPDFRFFPKLYQSISHYRQLNDVQGLVDEFIHSALRLEEKLGTMFLQMNEKFAPNRFDKLKNFISSWPKGVPLTVELRHSEWYASEIQTNELYALLRSNNICHTLVDTAGRRDLMHMRMTTPSPFIRFVGSNHTSDSDRLDKWVDRIEEWTKQGMSELYFFVHQNMELESPMLATQFIKNLNDRLGTSIRMPNQSPP